MAIEDRLNKIESKVNGISAKVLGGGTLLLLFFTMYGACNASSK